MTSDQFTWWLRGYLDSISLTEISTLPKVDVKTIRDALDRVGPATAPLVPPPAPKFSPPSFLGAAAAQIAAQKADHCYRCGKEQLGGFGHFCIGGYVNA